MTKYSYFEGAIRPIEDAKVSVMNQSLHYGTGCFGGIRGYWNADQRQLYVFRIIDHYKRFLNSARLILAELDFTPEQLADITVEMLRMEGWEQNCYIRPLVYKSDPTLAVRLHGLKDEVSIFSIPLDDYLPVNEGISVCTSSWRRVDDTAIPARGKLTGSYMNSSLIASEAMLNGYDDAIVLNHDGHVSEGSAANFMMVRDGVVITPPITSNVLEGITRRTVLYLMENELGHPVHERVIDRTELYMADEAFFCGTGAQIAPITSVDHRKVGNGEVGPITSQLSKFYFSMVRGQQEKYLDWLTPVYDR